MIFMYQILEETSLLHTYQVGIIMKIINMTLDEAIKHCEEVYQECPNRGCAEDHKQLADWLKQLRRLL